jgi:hypothetical protein
LCLCKAAEAAKMEAFVNNFRINDEEYKVIKTIEEVLRILSDKKTITKAGCVIYS